MRPLVMRWLLLQAASVGECSQADDVALTGGLAGVIAERCVLDTLVVAAASDRSLLVLSLITRRRHDLCVLYRVVLFGVVATTSVTTTTSRQHRAIPLEFESHNVTSLTQITTGMDRTVGISVIAG